MRRVVLLALLLLAAPAARAEDPKTKAKPAVVPFALLKTKHITLDITVNGKGPYRVLFDTGAPMTVLNNKLAKEAGLPVGGGLLGGKPAEVKSLQLGDLKAENVPVVVMDHPLVELMSKEKDIGPLYGIVGFPFFARYRVTIDYKAKKMTFVPSGFRPPDVLAEMQATIESMLSGKPTPTVLAPAAQWGLVAGKDKTDEDAGVTLKEVVAGGAAAAAGLKAGDRLLTLDGRWTDSIADLYTAAGFVKPGTPVKVVVTRGKKEMTITVTPVAGL